MKEKKTESPAPEVPIEVQPLQKTKINKKKLIIIIVVVLGVVFLSVAGYIIYTQFIQKPVDTTNQEESEEEDTEEESSDTSDVCIPGEEGCEEGEEEEIAEDEYTTFEGEVITATLPEGWDIVEYFDGEGTESLPEGQTYTGLTAIDIISDDNRQVFTLQAVSGIGFIGCPQYAVFDDDNESYRFEQESINDGLGEEMEILDYTDTEYSEFEFLDVTFRRVDDKYYYDTEEGNNYFESPCIEGLLTLEGLYFTDEDEYIYEAYFYGPTEYAIDEDLPIVDEILESVELI